MILNQSQAEAVYSAMCALNNVNGRLHARMSGRYEGSIVHCVEQSGGRGQLQIYWGDPSGNPHGLAEHYPNQAAFATAYGLNSDATPLVCSECQGRGEVETGIGMMVCTECPAR